MNKKLDVLKDVEWYVQGFNAVPLLIVFAAEGGVRKMKEELGFGYDYMMCSFNNDFCEWYYDVPSLKNIYERVVSEYEKDRDYVNNLIFKTDKHYIEIESFFDSLRSKNVSEMSKEEIVDKMVLLHDYYALTGSIPHIVEGFSLNSDKEIKEMLFVVLKSKGLQKQLPEMVTKLTMPTRKSFVAESDKSLFELKEMIIEDDELLKLFEKEKEVVVSEIGKFKEFEKKINDYVKDFFYIRSSYANAPFNNIGHAVQHLKQLLKEKGKPLDKYEAISKEDKEKLISDLEISGRLLHLIELADILTPWHDDRKKMILKCATFLDMLIEELARKIDISKENIRYLIPEEIRSRKVFSISAEELAERKNGVTFVYLPNETLILSGEDHKYFLETFADNHESVQIKEIPGICASTGRAVGRVKICKSLDAIKNFNEGDVLVTTMTRPEYVSAMKKACAIITDEGGITCHAAIISRELGKPCIIGTKNASKILKDGDLVEVKAGHGQVIIIERSV